MNNTVTIYITKDANPFQCRLLESSHKNGRKENQEQLPIDHYLLLTAWSNFLIPVVHRSASLKQEVEEAEAVHPQSSQKLEVAEVHLEKKEDEALDTEITQLKVN